MSQEPATLERATDYPHIVRTPDVMSGEPCLKGHRIRVRDIVALRDEYHCSAEQIVRDHYPHVGLAAVYAALGYAEDHREELAEMQASEKEWLRDFQTTNAGLIGPNQSQ